MKAYVGSWGGEGLPARKDSEMNKVALLPITNHTDDCNALRTSRMLERARWIAHYPRHCQGCLGFGGHTTDGSLYEPPIFEQCPQCLEQGICPRCGAAGANPDGWLTDAPVCATCHWDGTNDDAHRPFVPECYCMYGDDPLGPLDEHPF